LADTTSGKTKRILNQNHQFLSIGDGGESKI